MGSKRKPKAVARTITNAKKKAKAEPGSGRLRRAAKAREKAHAREQKVQESIRKQSSELDAALTVLRKTDVGSPKARKVEAAARAALEDMLVQRKNLGKARKALRRAEAKERKARDRAAAVTTKKASAAQSRKVSRKRPAAKKRPAEARAKSSATKPSAPGTLPAAETVSGADAGGLPESAALSMA